MQNSAKLQSAAAPAQSPPGEGASAATVHVRGTEMTVFELAGDSPPGGAELVWAHGWGHTHRNLLPLAEAMRQRARSLLVDFPGFGASPLPPGTWGTADYADGVAEWLNGLPPARRVWVAHSFGCRVGLQLAARHPEAVAGLFLIAAAGLPPQRSPWAQAKVAARRWVFRLARSVTLEGPAREWLRQLFGSADYRAAGALRPILVKTVGEDLSEAARAVRCPVVLVYGDADRETPPDMGARLNALMPGSRLYVLRGFDHWTVLTEGRHQLVQRLGEFLGKVA